MDVIEWANNPWGQEVPIHIAWWLMWLSLAAGLMFLAAHAAWLRGFAEPEAPAAPAPPEVAAAVPEKAPRHSLAARLFHWVMAAAMLALLATAFLPKAGLRFAWLNYHWIAGIVLILAIVFHLGHAVFYMDFWSIWPDPADLRGIWNALARARGKIVPEPAKPGKYPLGNKLYHLAALACALGVAATGALMLFRVRTPFLPRDPYVFDDRTWGLVYLLHGFAGVALIALAIVHVYFALRPEKLPLTRAMIFGALDRKYVLEHHDPRRWGGGAGAVK